MAPTESEEQPGQRQESRGLGRVVWAWLAWLAFLVVWSGGLLTPGPAHAAQEILPSPALYPTAKLVHVLSYLVFTLLTAWLPVTGRPGWLLLGFLTLHAFATEFLQQYVPDRFGSLLDVGIDHIGIVLGVALTWRHWRKLFWRRR